MYVYNTLYTDIHTWICVMLKTQSLCTRPNQILEAEFWVKWKRIALLSSQAKRDTMDLCLTNCVPQPAGFYFSNNERC